MQYYENSMKYAKFTLISVLILAIFTPFFKDFIIKAQKSKENEKQVQEQLIMQQIQEMQQNNQAEVSIPPEQEQVGRQNAESEDEFVERIIKERKNKTSDLTPEKENELRDIIRKEYRISRNLEPVESENTQKQETMNNINLKTQSEKPSDVKRVIKDDGISITKEEMIKNMPKEEIERLPDLKPVQD